jgi:predicted DNA-binding transcriptional regulator AlpA
MEDDIPFRCYEEMQALRYAYKQPVTMGGDMNESILLTRLDALTKAVLHMAQMTGTRLTKAELANRLGCHRNTLRSRVSEKGFPQPCADGKWLLSEIIEWEQWNARH